MQLSALLQILTPPCHRTSSPSQIYHQISAICIISSACVQCANQHLFRHLQISDFFRDNVGSEKDETHLKWTCEKEEDLYGVDEEKVVKGEAKKGERRGILTQVEDEEKKCKFSVKSKFNQKRVKLGPRKTFSSKES